MTEAKADLRPKDAFHGYVQLATTLKQRELFPDWGKTMISLEYWPEPIAYRIKGFLTDQSLT